MTSPRIPSLPVELWQMGLLDQVNRLTDGKARLGNNVCCTLANYPTLFIAWMQLGSYLFRHSSLPPRERKK